MKDTGGVLSTRVTSVSPRRWKNWSIYVLAIVAGGCAGGGCACVAPIPGGFPADARTPNSVQVRLSDSGLGYIENNVKDFIGLVLPGGLSFPIPSQCGSDQQVCCGASWCSIQADIDKRPGDAPRLELNPVASVPGLMDVVLRARVHTPYALPVRKKVLLFWTSCNVSINSRWSGNPSITIRTQVRFAEDPTSGEMRVRVAGASVSNLTAGDIDISGGLFCGFANENDVVSLFANEFANRVPAMIEEQVCKSCQTHDDCAPYGQCYTDGVCYINDGSGFRCMNSGGFSGRLQSRELLGSLAHPTRSRAVDFYVAQGGHRSTLDNGLTLGLLGGVMPHDRDSCVPVAPEPARPDIATASVLEQNVHPKTGATFDVGLGLHKSYLDRFAWAAQQAGWLCVNMSSASIEMLTASALSLFFPSIADLAPEGDAMLYLLVRPQKPPTMTLGAGTFTTDGSGANEIDEALLNIGLTDLEIDFYLQSDDQWVRVLTLVADATIPMALDVDGEGKGRPHPGRHRRGVHEPAREEQRSIGRATRGDRGKVPGASAVRPAHAGRHPRRHVLRASGLHGPVAVPRRGELHVPRGRQLPGRLRQPRGRSRGYGKTARTCQNEGTRRRRESATGRRLHGLWPARPRALRGPRHGRRRLARVAVPR